jgi:GMP synthase PP-ATPase subunit
LDLLCTILKCAKEPEDKRKIVKIFPELLEYLKSTEDMFFLMQGTTTLKTFIHFAASQVKEVSSSEQIIEVAKKLLDPKTNEQAGVCLGNLVIQIIHKI